MIDNLGLHGAPFRTLPDAVYQTPGSAFWETESLDFALCWHPSSLPGAEALPDRQLNERLSGQDRATWAQTLRGLSGKDVNIPASARMLELTTILTAQTAIPYRDENGEMKARSGRRPQPRPIPGAAGGALLGYNNLIDREWDSVSDNTDVTTLLEFGATYSASGDGAETALSSATVNNATDSSYFWISNATNQNMKDLTGLEISYVLGVDTNDYYYNQFLDNSGNDGYICYFEPGGWQSLYRTDNGADTEIVNDWNASTIAAGIPS